MLSSLIKTFFVLIFSLNWYATSNAEDLRGPYYSVDDDLSSECYYNQKNEFVLTGGIGKEAQRCIEETYKDGTETIRINSEGGYASYGLIIANRLKNENFDLVVEKRCSSACAIYIVPIAKSITMLDGSGIVLHGAPSDEQYSTEYERIAIQKLIESGLDKFQAKELFELDKLYLANQIKHGELLKKHHNVHDGWFMETGKWQTGNNDGVINQGAVTWLSENNVNGLLVSRRFFESCLPNVEIKKFFDPDDTENLNFPGFQERIKNAGLIVLPDATCVIN